METPATSARLKLKGGAAASPAPNSPAPDEAPQPIPLRPLDVSGVVVSKAALIDALRVYVPTLADLQVFEDGEQFLLRLAAS